MGFISRLFATVAPEPTHTRAIDSFQNYPGLTEQLLAVQGIRSRPYYLPSIREALSVPSIFRAVSLLSNTAASLRLEAFRLGAKMDEPPKIVSRPNPFSTRRAFIRNTVWGLATRGESFWWVSSRDRDGFAQSLIPMNPAEVKVDWAKGLEGIAMDFEWRDRKMPREDVVHLTFVREAGSLRGMGPLQLCGGAVSVSVEATEWAASYFGEQSGIPSILLKSPDEMTLEEARALKADWVETPSGQPKVASGGLEAEAFGSNPADATYVDIRDSSVGEAARMFGIPAHLMAYGLSGASLTYQNLSEISNELIRFTLQPNYLQPIEEAITDLLPRTTVTVFDTDALARVDLKTRYEVHTAAIAAGVYGADYAQELEGIRPGSTATAPVPNPSPAQFPSPAAIPEVF